MSLPISGAVSATGASPLAATHETTHFRLNYPSGGFAARNVADVGARLEAAWTAVSDLLDPEDDIPRVDVYLDEVPRQAPLDEPEDGLPPGDARGRLAIRDIFRTDSPGAFLERRLVANLAGRLLHDGRPPHPFVVDGLTRRALLALGSLPGACAADAQLATAVADKTLPPLADLMSAPEKHGSTYDAAAGSFLDFLIEERGPNRFRAFVRELAPGYADRAARTAYGETIGALDKAWRRRVIRDEAAGLTPLFRFLGLCLRPYRRQTLEIFLYTSLSVAFGIGLAKTQGLLIDKALVPRDLHALVVIMIAIAAAFVAVMAASLRLTYVTAWVSQGVVKDLRSRMFALVQNLHSGYFQRTQTGDILSRMTGDMDQLENALSQGCPQALRMGLTLVAALVTIFVTNWRLALLAVIGTPLFYLTNRLLGPATGRTSLERQEQMGQSVAELQEDLEAEPVVKAFSLQRRMIERYSAKLEALYRTSVRVSVLSGIYGLSATIITYAIQLAVLGGGAWLVIGGSLSIGTLFVFLALLTLIIVPIQSLSTIVQALEEASGSATRVQQLLAEKPAVRDRKDAHPLPRLTATIRFENVTFGYVPESPNLRNLNLAIAAGASVALVGPSGSGKSTVLALLMRFYDPQLGRITFDGADIRDGTLRSIRDQIGIVFQENILFDVSIRENIRVGKPSATDKEVEAAARAAEIHDYIASMHDGYDTVVGERGGRLSGGQRQRVAIARAIIRDPAILILDEATSALDPRTEAAINETVDRIGHGRTTVSVTHRLSSIVNAERIFVLDRGAVVDEGTHDELVERGGVYADLWKGQGGFTVGTGMQYVGVETSRLRGVPLFADLDTGLMEGISQHVYVERYRAGDLIVSEGDPGDRLYVLHKGQVDVLSSAGSPGERRLAVLHEGDHFGEMALLRGSPRTATIRARTPVQVYSLSRDDFDAMIASTPGLRQHLEDVVAQRERRSAGSPA